jgi:hypothetical protein
MLTTIPVAPGPCGASGVAGAVGAAGAVLPQADRAAMARAARTDLNLVDRIKWLLCWGTTPAEASLLQIDGLARMEGGSHPCLTLLQVHQDTLGAEMGKNYTYM